MRICRWDGCERPANTTGACEKHRKRELRKARREKVPPKPTGETTWRDFSCAEPECRRAPWVDGLCPDHHPHNQHREAS